jgi:hypothetical protein
VSLVLIQVSEVLYQMLIYLGRSDYLKEKKEGRKKEKKKERLNHVYPSVGPPIYLDSVIHPPNGIVDASATKDHGQEPSTPKLGVDVCLSHVSS